MTRMPCWIACLAALQLAAGTACAASPWEDPSRIRSAAVDWVRSQTPDHVTVRASALDSRLRLSRCEQPLSAASNHSSTGSAWNIAVSCPAARQSGHGLWTVHVPVQVSDVRTVVVLSRAASPGRPLTAEDLELQQRDVSSLAYGYLERTELVLGRSLRRPLLMGSTLSPDVLAEATVIRRGNVVTVLSQLGSLQVRSQGKALSDASTGETVSVQNLSSSRVVQGVVRDAGTVEVLL